MPDRLLTDLFLEQSNDLFWIIDSNLCLLHANQAFQNVTKLVTGKKIKIGESVFTKDTSATDIEKWKAYYDRGFNGEHFEVVDHYCNPETNDTQYIQVTFKPAVNKDQTIDKVACQSRDITSAIKSNDEAEKLLDASLDVICSIDEHGVFTKVSAACKELWGYEKHELVGKPYISFVIEEDVEKTNETAAEILLGKTVTAFENRYRKKDGGIASNLWSVRYDQNTKNLYCVARDAREKIKKQVSLLESEQRFKALVQEGADMISIIDAAGNYMYTSPTTTEILGITPEEFKGKSVFDFIHPDDIERAGVYVQRISTENKVVVEPFRLRDGNNEWRWIETVLTNMVENPAINGIVANSRDITEKKKETQHLKLLESVITNTNDAVLITEAEPFDEPGPRILYVNEAFTKMTGYTAEEVIGKTPRILQGPKSDRAELARLSKAIRKWEPCEITTINYKKNGEEFWINFSLTPVADETGWYTHWISIERDITEKKYLEIAADLTTTISAIFNEEVDLYKSLNKLCEEVAVKGFFSFCEIWLTNIEESLLELKAVHKCNEAADTFYQNSKEETVFKKEQGVPGEVWASGDSIIWEHQGENHQMLVRSEAAEKAGIKTVVGFPLLHHNKFIGVLQFGTQSSIKNIEWITNVLSEFGVFIGSEIARKKTENELKMIFEFAPDIIATWGFDGFFKTVNPYTVELLGYTEKEFTSKPLTDLLHPEDLQKTTAELEKLAMGYPVYNFENRYLTKSGEIKTISWNCSPAVEDGLIFSVGKDISEQVKMGNLLKDANQMMRIGGWEVDMINQEIHWSDVVYEIHEVDKNAELSLEGAIKFYRQDFQELVQSQIDYCIKTGLPVDFEALIVTAKNNEVWVRAMGRAELVNGQCIRIYGSFQDITQKKTDEIRMQSLSDNLPGTMFQYQLFADGTDRILNLTKGAENLWGISVDEGIENNALIWDLILAGGDMEKVRASLAESKTSLKGWYVHFRSRMPNGKVKWLEGLGTPRRLSDGSTIWDSIILDITHLKETEQLLASASKLARVGSWEIILQDNEEFKIFWDHIVKEIVEVEQSFEPKLADGINLYKEPSRTLIDTAVSKLMESGEAFDLELELVTKKGNDLWVRCIGDAQIENGQVTRIYGSFQDINTRKRAELNQLKLSEEKNNILESIGDAFFAVDNDWTVTYWNNVAEKLLQKSKDDIVGKNLWDVFQDAIDTDFYRMYHKAKDTNKTVTFEEYYETQNVWFEVTVYPSLKGLSIYFKDTTMRKEAEREIKLANDRFERVTEATNDVIWDWDIERETFIRSKAIDNFFGVGTPKVIRKRDFWKDNFHKEDLSKVKISLQNALEDPDCNRWEEEYRIFNNNNEIVFVKDRGLILRDNTGKAIQMVGAMSDISEIKHHEVKLLKINQKLNIQTKELQRSNEELEQFAFVTSHDLQEPLRMISSFMDQLKRKYSDRLDEKGLQYIHFATDGAKRMRQIILDLLLYSRANKTTEKNEWINLNEVVSEYTQLRRKVIAEKSATITYHGLPYIDTYRAPISQIFHCLLDNALKYVAENKSPHIEISAIDKENVWQFAIKDNGIGIDPKFSDKIFIIFQRLQNRKDHDGTGIGLAVAKRSVEFLGGEIWVKSEINKGAIFYFTIPKII